MTTKALIIGCGYTGARLARRLIAAGAEVTGTDTASGPRAVDAPGLRWQELDLLDDGPLELPAAADAVVYYMVSTLARRDEGKPHLPPFERCLAALSRQPLRGLVYLSSTSVYGDRQGDWVDEGSSVSPGSPWGRMRVELEQAVWRFGAERRVPACVARLPEIYGPGRGPVARLRRGHVVRAPERFSNRIHIDDLVMTLDQLGRDLDPPLLLVSDDEPAPTLDVYRFAAAQLGLGEDAVQVETGDVEADQDPSLSAPSGLSPLVDPNRRGLVTESKRCCNRRLRSWLRQPLRHPTYRDGITAILTAGPEPG